MELLEQEFPSVSPRIPHNPALRGSEESTRALENLEAQARTHVSRFIDGLDMHINKEAIRERLESISFGSLQEDSKHQGEYSPVEKLASVAIGKRTAQDRLHAAMHEFMHAASGQTLTLSGEQTVSVGLSRKHQFNWLNEAVTSVLTEMAEGKKYHDVIGDTSYFDEVAVLKELIKVTGIPFSAFAEAYFEQPDMDAVPGSRMPKWHTLQHQINDRLGPRAMLDISQLEESNFITLRKKDETGKSGLELRFEEWRDEKQKYGEAEARQRRLEMFSEMARDHTQYM